MEESIFQPYLSTRTIFKMDREILRPSYLPDRLPHRESHIGQLAQILVTVALDEIDKLVQKNGDDILYQLLKINDDLSKARVSLIGISNELTFTEYLDPRVRSRLADEKMVFPPYNADELYDILAERSRLAFENGTATDGVLQLIAALAAQEHGDARRALDLLRVSAELAERQGEEHITEEHVQRADERDPGIRPAARREEGPREGRDPRGGPGLPPQSADDPSLAGALHHWSGSSFQESPSSSRGSSFGAAGLVLRFQGHRISGSLGETYFIQPRIAYSRMNGRARRNRRLTSRLSQLFFGAWVSPQPSAQQESVGWRVSFRRPNQGISPRARPMTSD